MIKKAMLGGLDDVHDDDVNEKPKARRKPKDEENRIAENVHCVRPIGDR